MSDNNKQTTTTRKTPKRRREQSAMKFRERFRHGAYVVRIRSRDSAGGPEHIAMIERRYGEVQDMTRFDRKALSELSNASFAALIVIDWLNGELTAEEAGAVFEVSGITEAPA